MDLLAGCFFNAIWIIGALISGFVFCALFTLTPWPAWLESGITMALSLLVGLTGMAFTITKMMGKSWGESLADAKLVLGVGGPTLAACVMAVVCYLISCRFTSNEEIQKLVVGAVSLGFWFWAMDFSTKRLETQYKARTQSIHDRKTGI